MLKGRCFNAQSAAVARENKLYLPVRPVVPLSTLNPNPNFPPFLFYLFMAKSLRAQTFNTNKHSRSGNVIIWWTQSWYLTEEASSSALIPRNFSSLQIAGIPPAATNHWSRVFFDSEKANLTLTASDEYRPALKYFCVVLYVKKQENHFDSKIFWLYQAS